MSDDGSTQSVSQCPLGIPSNVDIHLKHLHISAWLANNRSNLFRRKASVGKDYVAVDLAEPVVNKKPTVYYVSNKKNLLSLIKKRPLAVFQYRHYNRMQLMF